MVFGYIAANDIAERKKSPALGHNSQAQPASATV
jgi:hypothetical protein